jgi:hypothetical protein
MREMVNKFKIEDSGSEVANKENSSLNIEPVVIP